MKQEKLVFIQYKHMKLIQIGCIKNLYTQVLIHKIDYLVILTKKVEQHH